LDAEIAMTEDQARSAKPTIRDYVNEQATQAHPEVDYPYCIDASWQDLAGARQKIAILENRQAMITAHKPLSHFHPQIF
jgi:hypothetical protein